jgi:hypothetical protein
MQTQELFVSVTIIISQIIGVVVFVAVFVFVGDRSRGGGPAIFLIRECRTGMCGTLLYFGEQVPQTRL